MDVVPLTLTISLCLVFTFVIFFLREHARSDGSSAESAALLPLAEENASDPMSAAPGSRTSHNHQSAPHVR